MQVSFWAEPLCFIARKEESSKEYSLLLDNFCFADISADTCELYVFVV
jgi:hypothetical protein